MFPCTTKFVPLEEKAKSKYLSVIFFILPLFQSDPNETKRNETKHKSGHFVFGFCLVNLRSFTRNEPPWRLQRSNKTQKRKKQKSLLQNQSLPKIQDFQNRINPPPPQNIPIFFCVPCEFVYGVFECFVYLFYQENLPITTPRADFTSPHTLPFFLYTSFGHSPLSPVQYSGISQSFRESRQTKPCARSCKFSESKKRHI